MAHHIDFAAEPAMKKMRVHANELRQPLDSLQRQSRFPTSSHPVNARIHVRQPYSGFQRNYPPWEMDHHHKCSQQVGRHARDVTLYSVAPSATLHQHSHRPRGGLPGMSSLLQSSGSPPPPRRPLESGPLPPHLHRWASAGSPSPPDAAGSSHPRHNWGVDHSSSYYHHDALPAATSSTFPPALKRSPSSSTASTSEDDEAVSVVTAKSSRYLREMDRRAILHRLANGEKQATLAKEYQVSRAAICNLNKHRDEVMSRGDENPFAKHPKKRKLRTAAASSSTSSPTVSTQTEPTSPTVVTPSDSIRSSSPGAEGTPSSATPTPTVHVVKSRAVQLLLTTLRSPSTASAEFRRGSERLMRLVMEDALALVPCKAVGVALNDQVKVEGMVRSHPPCAISMEQLHCPLMDLFHLLEPDHPTGYARVTSSSSSYSPSTSSSSGLESGSGAERVHLLAAHVPPTLRYHNVFLLDLVATGGEVVCESIRRLLQRGAVEERIHLVALFVSSEVVAMVQCKYPRVQLVTTQIDSGLNNRRPSSSSSSSAPSAGRSTLDGVLQRLHDMYQQLTQSKERAASPQPLAKKDNSN